MKPFELKIYNEKEELVLSKIIDQEILLDIMTKNNIDPHSHYYKLV